MQQGLQQLCLQCVQGGCCYYETPRAFMLAIEDRKISDASKFVCEIMNA